MCPPFSQVLNLPPGTLFFPHIFFYSPALSYYKLYSLSGKFPSRLLLELLSRCGVGSLCSFQPEASPLLTFTDFPPRLSFGNDEAFGRLVSRAIVINSPLTKHESFAPAPLFYSADTLSLFTIPFFPSISKDSPLAPGKPYLVSLSQSSSRFPSALRVPLFSVSFFSVLGFCEISERVF